MIFHSFDFLIFFVLILGVYWLLSRPHQNIFLVAVSCFFYGYIHPWFLIPFAVTTLIDFFSAIGMQRFPRIKRRFLLLSLFSNLGLLGVFKYFGFFVENVNHLLSVLGLGPLSNTMRVILPVGISFYTFQSLAYIFEVYRGTISARQKLIDYAVYVSFFPQLVAGPIERPTRMLPQVERDRTLTVELARSSLLLIIWGYFKKLVIADSVAVTCNKIFSLDNVDFAMLWVGVFSFAVQIYADFSAYTDIARGCARLLGFELMENFNHPYFANSPVDFWRRWHISLSSWFRDYVYFPLGGSRVSRGRGAVNVIAVFLLSGLWHGASWNFVLWGFYWGVLIVGWRWLESFLPSNPSKVIAGVQVAMMFLLTCFGWLMFRETNLHYLMKYLALSPFRVDGARWSAALFLFVLSFLYSIPIWIHSWWDLKLSRNDRIAMLFKKDDGWLATGVCLGLFIGILALRSPVASDFIYFQF